MGRIAALGDEHWRKYRPTAYAALEDPPAYFKSLEEEAWDQIEDLADALAGPDDPAETFMEKVSRVTQARSFAESQVLREMVLLPEETPEQQSDQPHSDAELEGALAEFNRLRDQFLSGHPEPDESE